MADRHVQQGFRLVIKIALIFALISIIAYIAKTLLSQGNQVIPPIRFEDLSPIWVRPYQPVTDVPDRTNPEQNPAKDKPGDEHEQAVVVMEKPDSPCISQIDSMLSDFISRCIDPNAEIIKRQNVYDTVQELVKLLKDNPETPSIVMNLPDEETVEIPGLAKNLAKVPLVEHTVTATEILLDMMKETYTDYEVRIPMAIIAGLAHDIGKIRSAEPQHEQNIDSARANDKNHSSLSASLLSGLFALSDPPHWAGYILSAIKTHHETPSEQFAVCLKKADLQARNYELIRFMPGHKILPFKTWFDTEKFVKKYIEPFVNVTQAGGCAAFTLHDIVYVETEHIKKAVRSMASDMNIFDITLHIATEEGNILRETVSRLRKENYIHDILQQPRVTIQFQLVDKTEKPRKMKMRLTPFRADAFNLQELETRKAGFLLDLIDIKYIG